MILDSNHDFRNEILSVLKKSKKQLKLSELFDIWPTQPVQLVSELNHMIKDNLIIGDTNNLNKPFKLKK